MTRGRPVTDISQTLRRQVWYYYVKLTSGKSDYRLSKIFGGEYSTGDERRRIFERLRKANEMPFRGSSEFINEVEMFYKGSSDLYMSGYWELINNTHLEAKTVYKILLVALRKLDLLRNWHEYFPPMIDITHQRGIKYDNSVKNYILQLETVLKDRACLDSLTVIGALYRISKLSPDQLFTNALQKAFKNKLNLVKKNFWMPEEYREDFEAVSLWRISGASQLKDEIEDELFGLFRQDETVMSPGGQLIGWLNNILIKSTFDSKIERLYSRKFFNRYLKLKANKDKL